MQAYFLMLSDVKLYLAVFLSVLVGIYQWQGKVNVDLYSALS